MRQIFVGLVVAAASVSALGQGAADKAWIAKSNGYTQSLLDVQLKHSPERGSRQGLVEFDKLISNPTLADEKAERKELEAVLAKLKAAQASEKDKNVLQDIAILKKAFDLQFREQDYGLAHNVPFINAGQSVFGGLRGLLDDQVAAERRPDAVVRLRKYAGVEAGYTPLTEILKQRTMEQIAKTGMVYPSKTEVETELGRNQNYVDGIAKLFTKYKLTGWEEPYTKLKVQLTDYDAWVKTTILPKARTDFREPAAEYALDLEGYGIDISPAQMAEMAHKAFGEYQAEMAPIAAQIAKKNGYASSDYRDVIRELKKTQLTGDDILPFYEKRLHEIEAIVAAQKLVTLPDRPAIILAGYGGGDRAAACSAYVATAVSA